MLSCMKYHRSLICRISSLSRNWKQICQPPPPRRGLEHGDFGHHVPEGLTSVAAGTATEVPGKQKVDNGPTDSLCIAKMSARGHQKTQHLSYCLSHHINKWDKLAELEKENRKK